MVWPTLGSRTAKEQEQEIEKFKIREPNRNGLRADLALADRLMTGKNIPSTLKSRKNPLTMIPLTVNEI